MLRVRENERSLRKWSGGTAQFRIVQKTIVADAGLSNLKNNLHISWKYLGIHVRVSSSQFRLRAKESSQCKPASLLPSATACADWRLRVFLADRRTARSKANNAIPRNSHSAAAGDFAFQPVAAQGSLEPVTANKPSDGGDHADVLSLLEGASGELANGTSEAAPMEKKLQPLRSSRTTSAKQGAR